MGIESKKELEIEFIFFVVVKGKGKNYNEAHVDAISNFWGEIIEQNEDNPIIDVQTVIGMENVNKMMEQVKKWEQLMELIKSG